jgi:hypothetical protein
MPQYGEYLIGSEALTEVVMKISGFWDVTPCSKNLWLNQSANSSTSCLVCCLFHARFLLNSNIEWWRHIAPKRRLTFNGLHGDISHNTVFSWGTPVTISFRILFFSGSYQETQTLKYRKLYFTCFPREWWTASTTIKKNIYIFGSLKTKRWLFEPTREGGI